jgi:hypothetical protein
MLDVHGNGPTRSFLPWCVGTLQFDTAGPSAVAITGLLAYRTSCRMLTT